MEMITINPEKDVKMVSKKPPLPPKPQQLKLKAGKGNQMQWKNEEDSAHQAQKLIALNDTLNVDIGELRKQLHHERVAVRELRATHDSEYRKLKNETKKLLEVVGNVKKTAGATASKHLAEIAKLSEEVTTLRDAKNALDRKVRCCSCAAVLLKGAKPDAKIDHITATAKAEIQKLLEELKSKDREISSLKNQWKAKEEIQMRVNMTDGEEPRGERFVTHVDLTEPYTPHRHPTTDDATFKAVIKMDENHHTIMPRPDKSIRTSPNATTIIELKQSSSPQGQSSAPHDDIRERKSFDFLQTKYEIMKRELCESRARIDELEQSLVEQNNNFMDNDRFQDRVMYLEEREKCLEKETHELREQNELLEFRILELEENQDKWSLRSNLTPDSKDTCSCWREKESDDLMMMSSDSGITSPNSHHFDQQSVSPCSISLMDQLPTDDMRAHITKMSKRSFYNEDDKSCFQQMIVLINSLEALSQDHNLVGDDFSSMEYSMDKIKTSHSKIPEPVLPLSSQMPASPPKHPKIVATVQPYSTSSFRSFVEPKKGIEYELSVLVTQETQTESADDTFKTNADLYAEIDKLNRFRKKVEESSKTSLRSVPSNISPNTAHMVSSVDCETIERRHLKFYQERMKMLEDKLEVLESSGDAQTKLLSRRLEHEVQLESKVNRLEETVHQLKWINQELEENNCELEEIENETRFRCQKMDEEFEVMNQRNSELEMSKNSYHEKYEEARESVEYLEECLHGSEMRIKSLESHQKELKRRLHLSQSFIPAVALFQMWKMKKMNLPPMIKPPAQPSHIEIPDDHPIHQKLLELQSREKQLTQTINDLNRAYQETLENADNLWAQMEKEYKDKISHFEKLEASLRSKIQHLEKRLLKDTEDSYERIAMLEENEYQLKNRNSKVCRDLKEQQKKNTELLDELSLAKDEHQKIQAYINGPAADNLEKERKKSRRAEEELTLMRNALKDTENAHKNEQTLLKRNLQKMHKELKNFEVTNGELKEEVDTLERRIVELESYQVGDKTKIKELIDELETKCHQIVKPVRPSRSINTSRTLAQELNHRPVPIPRQKTVIPIERCCFADAIERFEHFDDQKIVTREVKSLADSIISNAESNGYIPVKRSFVEEARQKFSKWM